MHGAKHWFLQDPGTDWPGNFMPACQDFNTDLAAAPPSVKQCVQLPGELIFLPDSTWHATCNLATWSSAAGGQNFVAGLDGDLAEVVRAAWDGDISRLTALKAAGASLTAAYKGAYALHFATRNGQLETVRYLVETAGADVNQVDLSESSELEQPSKYWTFKAVRPIHIAARFGHAEIVAFLLKAGADAESRDAVGRTPVIAPICR